MTHHTVTAAELASAIRNVPDFPKPGIQFKDITPVLGDARLFAGAIDLLTADFVPGSIDAVVGIDARGFVSRKMRAEARDLFARRSRSGDSRGHMAEKFFPARNYNLAATLASGQAFRWYPTPNGAWEGVIGNQHLTLRRAEKGIE